MSWTARDLMQTEVRTVTPQTTLVDLERRFLDDRVSGYPVVEDGRLVGIVSRSDVVRQLSVEQSVAETFSDYYRDVAGFEEPPSQSLARIGAQVGARIEGLRVKDFMMHAPITAAPDDPLSELAKLLLEQRIHRIPVVEGGRLVGIVSSLDLVRLFAEGRAQPI
jgi:CBS domain-containing protein